MRIKRSVLAAAIALALLPSSIHGQEATSPFVSRLKAEAIENQVKLSWKDSADIKGTLVMYRSTEELTDKNIDQAAVLGRVQAGVEFYVDTPPDMQPYFYAVLIEDANKRLFKLLVPFRNKTSAGVAVTIPPSEEQMAARITGISAHVPAGQEIIVVSFTASPIDRDLLLFWSTLPMRTPEDLLSKASNTHLDAGVSTYEIPTIPGVDYYFAVLDAGLYKIGQSPLEPGKNTTVVPVQIPLPPGVAAAAPQVSRRALPLPALVLALGVQSGSILQGAGVPALPAERKVGSATSKAISALLQGITVIPALQMKPRILPADTTPSPGGELAGLQGIVRGPFTAGDMAGAEKQLRSFLSLQRAEDVGDRARFYLAQTYFFQGKVREAFLEFLLTEDSLYHETQAWKDACLRTLWAEGTK